jgi:hypothetical protein
MQLTKRDLFKIKESLTFKLNDCVLALKDKMDKEQKEIIITDATHVKYIIGKIENKILDIDFSDELISKDAEMVGYALQEQIDSYNTSIVELQEIYNKLKA